MPFIRNSKRAKENQLLSAFKFVCLFLALFCASFLLLALTSIPNYIAAITSQLALKLFFSVDSSIIFKAGLPQIQTANLTAEIADLCSGKIEIAVLLGIIFASFEKKMKYRIYGFFIGVLVLLLFNAIRISTTIYFFDTGNLEWSAIFHDLLFRAFLVVIIVTYYAIWYFYDQPRKTKK